MSEEIKNEEVTVVAEETANTVSKSKAKREARKAEVKSEKSKKSFDKVLGWVIGIIIAAVVVGAIGMGIYQSAGSTTSSGNYSEGLTNDGFVEKANLNKVKDLGIESLTIAFADVEYTDEEVENDIATILSQAAYFDDNSSLTVQDGDTINLDYVGSVDGVEFEGGNTNGYGAELTIGSQTYIDDFEEQLIGSHPGDAVTVVVNFPDEYSSNPDLAGKEAVFECTVNGIRTTPELTDEFVAGNYGEYASTVEELRTFIKTNGYESNVKAFISNYIGENASASAPSSYLKHLRSVIKYTDEQNYQYYNEYYYYYLGSYLYSSFDEYTGKSESEYEAYLKEEAKAQASVDLTYESIFKNNNLSIEDEVYEYILTSYGSESTYGEAYLKQVALKSTVLEYLAGVVTVQ